MSLIPPDFPTISQQPVHVGALAYYPVNTPGLERMQFEARGEVVDLTHCDASTGGLIGVPRTLAPQPLTDAQDRRAVGAFTFDAEFKSDLRPEQVPFVDGVFRMMEDELGGIGEAPTGFGKTTTGCALVARIGRPTCIIIPKGDLDWTSELLTHTTIPKERIDYWQGQRLPDPNAWVVVAMLQSVYRTGVYPQEVYDRFACVIIDEVHRLGSTEFSAAMRKFPAMWRLGLSATPDRRDGRMALIHSHIGWRHVVGHTDAEQPDYFVIQSGWSEPFMHGKRVPFDPSRTNMAKRSLMADTVRNAQIVAAAGRAHRAGRRTIVFVEQTKHSERLRAGLLSSGVPPGSVVEYNGGIKDADRQRAQECAPGIVLIATYKYTAEGTNIPALDTAVIAHPIYDPRQAVGRILRKVPGKPTPVVIDVVDANSPALARIAAARWEYLRRQGARWRGPWVDKR